MLKTKIFFLISALMSVSLLGSCGQVSGEGKEEEHHEGGGGGEHHDDPPAPVHVHSGYHYLASSPDCSHYGNKEFYKCSTCGKESLILLDGQFSDKKLDFELNSSHIAYIPKDPTLHKGFDSKTGLCASGCGLTISECYHLDSDTSKRISLDNFSSSYNNFVSLPESTSSHIFHRYDYLENGGIDFVFDYSYEYNNTDSWIYFYLFNDKNEDGVVVRLNTRKNDGFIKGFVYSKTNYGGNLPINPSEENTFTLTMPKSETSGFIHVVANITDFTNNTIDLKMYLGQDGSDTEYAPKVKDSSLNYTFTLGSNYFKDCNHQFIRFSNRNSNAKIKAHSVAKKIYYCNGDFTGYFGSRSIKDSLVLPVLYKENSVFNGWKNENGELVKSEDIFEKDTYLVPSFSNESKLPISEGYALAVGKSVTLDCSLPLGNDQYLTIDYQSNEPIVGTFNFYTTENRLYTEDFYLDKNETTFSSFLDVYRKNCKNTMSEKTLSTITFKNVGKDVALFKVNDVKHSNKQFLAQDNYYLEDEVIKAGVSISLGGGLSFLQNKNRNSLEYIDTNNEVKIRTRDKITNGEIKKEIISNPNLINIYDHGREIQQSYYMDVDESNGYERGTYLGAKRRYNPVQSGDQYLSESKIVDYEINANSIYIKVQAADWAKNNELTKSYMSNRYTIKNGLLYVENSFVDFYGFTNYNDHDGEVEVSANTVNASQELPALYTVHSLNYFSSVFTDGATTKEIFDKNCGWNTSDDGVSGKTVIGNISQLDKLNADGTYSPNLIAGTYYYGFRKHSQNWVGFFNEDKFGLAMYVSADKYNHSAGSNRHIYIGAEFNRSQNINDIINRDYRNESGERIKPTAEQFLNDPIPSCYVNNTNYITSMLGLVIREYAKFSWSYALGADYLDNLKTKFASIQNSGELYNDFTSMTGTGI